MTVQRIYPNHDAASTSGAFRIFMKQDETHMKWGPSSPTTALAENTGTSLWPLAAHGPPVRKESRDASVM